MADKIDSLEIEIESSSKEAVSRINDLVNALKRLKTATGTNFKNPISSFSDGVTSTRRSSSTKKENFQSKSKTVAGDSLPGVETISKAIDSARQKYEELIQYADTNSGKITRDAASEVLRQISAEQESLNKILDRIDTGVGQLPKESAELYAALDDLKSAENQFKDIWNRPAPQIIDVKSIQAATDSATKFQEALNATKEATDPVVTQMEKLKEETVKVYASVNLLKGALSIAVSAGKALGKISLKGITAGILTAGKYITDKFTSPFKTAIKTVTAWKNAIGRIMFYRAIRGAIRMVTDGFKEGVENLYQYSKIAGTQFAPAMNSLATSAQYFRNSLGAMVAPLIQSIAPAVDFLIDKFVALLNVIGKTFAALTGRSTYSQAIKLPKDYAEATDNASKSMNKFLLGIDELNIMSEPSGGAGAAADYGSMFEEVEVPSETMDWAAKIKEAIKSGDWAGAGYILADKLNEIVSGIDTESLGKKIGSWVQNGINAYNGFMDKFNFEEVGSKVAKFFNGLGNSINPQSLGKALSQKIKAGIDLAYGFVSNFNFSVFGEWVSSAVNGFFENIDFAKAGQTVATALTGITEAIYSFAIGIDWENISSQISSFFINAINGISDWAKGFDFKKAGKDIYSSLKNAIQGINYTKLASSFARGLGSAIGGAAGFVVGFIGNFVGDVVRSISNYFSQYIGELDGDWLENGMHIVSGILKGILDGLVNIGKWIVDNIFKPFIQGFKDAFGIHSPSTVMAEQGGYIIQGLLNGILNALISVGTWINDNIFSPIVNAFKSLFGIDGETSSVFVNFGTSLIGGLKFGIASAWSAITGFFAEKIESLKVNLSNAWANIKDTASTAWEGITNTIAGAFNGLKELIKAPINAIIGFVEKMANGIIKGINTAVGALNNLKIDIPDWIPGIGGNKLGFNIGKLSEISIPRLADGGMVNQGQMFIAREAGPELVGQIGNRTAVANNDQIVSGISEGVEEANIGVINAVYAMANQIVNAINSKDGGIYLDGKQLARAMQGYNAQAERNKGSSFVRVGV